MNRSGPVAWLLGLCLGTVALAAAPQSAPPAQLARHPAAEALAAGRLAKGNGELARAEVYFQEVLARAERGDANYAAALDELTYYLPLMRVARHLQAGRRGAAEQGLQALLEQHQADEEKSAHLVTLLARLRDQTSEPGRVLASRDRGRQVLDRVQRRLARYRDANGHYPRDYAAINEILPPDRYPLDAFDIVRYASSGRGYALTLRSRADPDQLLSVQHTGLVQ